MTTNADLASPVTQLSDAAVADLQLVLDGVALPWTVLGGSADRPGSGRTGSGQPGLVAVDGPDEVLAAAAARGELILTDREQTPIAALRDLQADAPAGTVAGTAHPLRARESRLFADRTATTAQLGPGTERRHVVLVGRPLLDDDLTRLAELAGLDRELVLMVPVEGPTPDGVPPTTLMRSVLHAAADLGAGARVVAVPVFWRGEASDALFVWALAEAYGAASSEVLAGGSAWTDLLAALQAGQPLPSVAPEPVLAELRRWRPPPSRRGAMILFSGLSGSGKSTLARDLVAHIVEHTPRTVSLLDGDDVRRLLSSGLGFDRAARDLNVRRIGFVGSEIARHGGLAVCAPIAPYAESRAAVRAMVEPVGDFVLVYVSTPLEECERRDLKGLYAKARAGVIAEFTGISDPYDEPVDADLVVDTSKMSRTDALDRVLDLMHSRGWIIEDDRQGQVE